MVNELMVSQDVQLPKSCWARGGTEFNPRDTVWSFRAGVRPVSMNFALMRDVDDAILPSLKATLLWSAENMSGRHAANMFSRLLHFFQTLRGLDGKRPRRISVTEIMNYRSALTSENGWYLGSLAGAIKRWSDLGYPGVDKDAVQLLHEIKIEGNRKGEAVRTMCPIEGPLSDIEYEGVIVGLNRAYTEKSLNLNDYLLCWLATTLGARPAQLAALKVIDLSVNHVADGSKFHVLRVPRAKQRHQGARDSFTSRPIIPHIGELLELQVANVRSGMSEYFDDPAQAPMLPGTARSSAPGFLWHFSAPEVGARLKYLFGTLAVVSERTGEVINLTSLRLRRTLGTRSAMEGHGVLVIAELLDHTDTQNAGVYVEARPEIVERIDKALALHIAPVAQAFAGVLIDGERKSGARRNPIIDPRFDEGRGPVGTCGGVAPPSLARDSSGQGLPDNNRASTNA